MNLTAQINALAVELRMRGTIPCALLGRKVRDTECCSRGLAATVKEFQTCRACPEGQRLAASAPRWGFSRPLPAPVAKPAAAPKPARKPTPQQTKRQAKPVAKPVAMPAFPLAPLAEPLPMLPNCPCVDPRLARLASVLRELTADGRMRVSMLDLMRALGAANYDEAAGLVIHAGLRTSQLSGPVHTVLVDHTARQLMASAASEVRQ